MSSKDGSTRAFLHNLAHELFQTETSAARHAKREAKRLGDAPPAAALMAVAEHAEAVLRELPALARRNDMPTSDGGRAAGRLFSEVRERIGDRLVDGERSYRGTLLGCRHGIDVVRLLQHVAQKLGMVELDAFCATWLNTRVVLVQRVEDELCWFVEHPEAALRSARPLVPGLRLRTDAPS